MAQLTSKELMLIEDNIKMNSNATEFISAAANMCRDPELKSLCQELVRDHRDASSILTKHITGSTTLQ